MHEQRLRWWKGGMQENHLGSIVLKKRRISAAVGGNIIVKSRWEVSYKAVALTSQMSCHIYFRMAKECVVRLIDKNSQIQPERHCNFIFSNNRVMN